MHAGRSPGLPLSWEPKTRLHRRRRRHSSEVSGEQPVVWASRIIGFGELAYRHESGHGGTMPVLAFSPAARHHTIYLTSDFDDRWPELMTQLGRYRSGTSCLYLTRLHHVDQNVLRELLERTRDHALAEWPERA